MRMLPKTVFVAAGSMTQIFAPILMTVADALVRMPAKEDVIWTMRRTEKVVPTSNAVYLPLSLTKSLYAKIRSPFMANSNALTPSLLCEKRASPILAHA